MCRGGRGSGCAMNRRTTGLWLLLLAIAAFDVMRDRNLLKSLETPLYFLLVFTALPIAQMLTFVPARASQVPAIAIELVVAVPVMLVVGLVCWFNPSTLSWIVFFLPPLTALAVGTQAADSARIRRAEWEARLAAGAMPFETESRLAPR